VTVAAGPDTPPGTPFEDDMLACRAWSVPQMWAPHLYMMVRLARLGVPVEILAQAFEIDEDGVTILCLHHHVGVKRGARYMPAVGRLRPGTTHAAHTHPED
jgi:hypothetical protein